MKIGLLGGSFNPPHSGHIHISLEARKRLGLHKIWWLPTKQNPFKSTKNPMKIRVSNCQDITKNHPKISVCDLEKNITSVRTIDLLKKISAKYPQHQFSLIIGADNILQFHNWKNWRQIIKLAPLIVCDRENFFYHSVQCKAFLYAKKLSRVTFLRIKKSPESSTKIREKMPKESYDFLVDSHCHLDLLAEKGFNIDETIKNAQKNQVRILQTIGTKISNFNKIYKYAEQYENVFASVGIHPCNVEEEPKVKAEELIKFCQTHPKIIGIGETGLDYFHPNFNVKNQIASFIEHIEAARMTGLPLIIHTRDADLDMAKILEGEMKKGKFKALLHCFSSSRELAIKAVELGIYISISGIVTFKNATDLQNIIKNVPLEYLLVETDSPYLAPTPHRGKINQPCFTKCTAEFLADLKRVSFAEICQSTTSNFFRLFSLAKELTQN